MNIFSNLKARAGIIGLLLLAWLCIPAGAQENVHFESWNTYSTRYFLTKHRFWLRNDIGIQLSFDEDPSTMYLLRPRLIVNLGNIVEFHPAVDFRYSYYPNSDNTFELRTWQGLRMHWPYVGRFMFDHFYRFEQRFHWTEGVPQGDVGLRSRYRLNMRVPINNQAITNNTLFCDIRGEAFINHGEGIQETYASTIRLGLNLGYHQNQKWRYQITGYVDRGEDTVTDTRTKSRYILALTVRTTF